MHTHTSYLCSKLFQKRLTHSFPLFSTPFELLKFSALLRTQEFLTMAPFDELFALESKAPSGHLGRPLGNLRPGAGGMWKSRSSGYGYWNDNIWVKILSFSLFSMKHLLRRRSQVLVPGENWWKETPMRTPEPSRWSRDGPVSQATPPDVVAGDPRYCVASPQRGTIWRGRTKKQAKSPGGLRCVM